MIIQVYFESAPTSTPTPQISYCRALHKERALLADLKPVAISDSTKDSEIPPTALKIQKNNIEIIQYNLKFIYNAALIIGMAARWRISSWSFDNYHVWNRITEFG